MRYIDSFVNTVQNTAIFRIGIRGGSEVRGGMDPGSELDALIAEKVMGFKVGRFGHGDPLEIITPRSEFFPIPNYSTSIEAAWEVVEKLGILHGAFTLIQHPDSQPFSALTGKWHSGFGKFVGEADTAPHAICLAALKAVT